MSTREGKGATCRGCGGETIRVSMKNPYIDDYRDECPKCDEPGSALRGLNASARSQARQDHE